MGLVGKHLALDVSEKVGGRVTSTGLFPRFLKKTISREGITLSEIQKVGSRPRDFFCCYFSLCCCLSGKQTLEQNKKVGAYRKWKTKCLTRTTYRESLGHWPRQTVDAKSSTTRLLPPLSGIHGSKCPVIPVTDLFCVHITQRVSNRLRLWPHTECS